MNLNPFIDLISKILGLYNTILTVWVIISLLIYFGIVNSYQPVVSKIMYFLNGLILPVLERIRKFVPTIGGVDISVVVLYLLITFITNILYTYFYR
jgi:YggT family protein